MFVPALATLTLLLLLSTAHAADLTVREVSLTLAKSDRQHPADFSGRSLRDLDLSSLDFRGANLAHADLYGTDLSNADLSEANLAGATLDHATITATDFRKADLSGASLYMVAAYSTLDQSPPAEAPTFAGAKLAGAHIIARLSGVAFTGADLSNAVLGTGRDAKLIAATHSDLSGADLTGAELQGANLVGVRLRFVRLTGADLAGTRLDGADLSRADLTNANLAGAELAGSDLDGTIVRGTRGLDSAHGLDHARDRDKLVQ